MALVPLPFFANRELANQNASDAFAECVNKPVDRPFPFPLKRSNVWVRRLKRESTGQMVSNYLLSGRHRFMVAEPRFWLPIREG